MAHQPFLRTTSGRAVVGVLALAALTFNTVVGLKFDSIAEANGTLTTKNVDRNYTLSEGTRIGTEIEEEGATLLYNENGALPLADKKVTILGAGSHNYVQGGTGSAGGRDDSNTAMLDKAFSNAGIDYNTTAWEWLTNALGGGSSVHNGGTNAEYLADGDPVAEASWTGYQTINEFSPETYAEFVTDDVIGEYSDVAVVTFSRSGAEGASPSLDYDANADTTTGRTYLELDDNEKALLEFTAAHFDSTVVLINSASPMEAGFVTNSAYNVDALLWIGHPGEAGLYGVANVLAGAANPSGHLVDTWAYDMSTNPTYYSANDQTYSNVTLESKNTYYEYNEGIYVGYRYYETADAAGYFDSAQFQATKFKGNLSEGKYFSDLEANGSYEEQKAAGPQATYSGYDQVVQFPFGYGLSYTSFSQEITTSDVTLATHGENSITVNVTNTGEVAGKDVVQLYLEAPYDQDGSVGADGVALEKPQVVLVGFGKTGELAPGESEEVTVEFSTDDLAAYDQFGQGSYVLEQGTYTFHVSPNAHGWADEEAYGADFDTLEASVGATVVYTEDGDGARVGTMNDVTVTEGQAATNAMNDITAGDGAMLVNGGASGTYTLGYLSRADFGAGMTEVMSYQSDDLVGKYSGNGYVWSADGAGTTPVVTGDVAGQRAAADIVQAAIETTPTELEGSDGLSEGMEYAYQDILSGVSFGDGETSTRLYGYGNDSYINEKYTRDGLTQDDESYLVADSGLEIAWGAVYYVALDGDEATVEDEDGYVKIYDSESDAAADGTATKLQAKHLSGVPGDDYTRWDKLTNMLSFAEADTLFGDNAWHQQSAESVGKEFALSVDGPGEAGNAQNADATWWPSAVVIAATWNTDLAEQQGVSYGQQDLLNNTPNAYAPAMNIHRTPFGGRNFEYYSEDGFISGVIGGNVVAGMQSTGLHVFIKHMALNDSDTNRGGVNTWADEASIREIYAKPYEIAAKYFDADGIMGSLNSMGMAWSHSGFYIDLVRDEWGWNGMLITDGDGTSSDAYNHYSFWALGAQGGILGTGPLTQTDTYTTVSADGSDATPYLASVYHDIARRALYQYAHNYDALSASSVMTPNTGVPITILAVGNGVLLLGAAAVVLVLVRRGKKKDLHPQA